jgi:hypothetical protein
MWGKMRVLGGGGAAPPPPPPPPEFLLAPPAKPPPPNLFRCLPLTTSQLGLQESEQRAQTAESLSAPPIRRNLLHQETPMRILI